MSRFHIPFAVFAVGCLWPSSEGIAASVPAWAAADALVFADEGQAVEGKGLAIPPPEDVSNDQFLKTLPRRGGKLLGGEPFTILAIGDSVTATGPYPEILKRLLARATGNRSIRVVRAAYSGRSVDAAVRRFDKDVEPAKADLALIMFGLNDQAAGSSPEAYLEQTGWLVERLRAQGADVVLLEPTPHINITPMPGDKGPQPPEASVFRTVGFAAALRELGARLDTPVAPTFDALWGDGGPDLQQAAKNAWPLFPAHYSKSFTSLVETAGKGDTIHPNARGHLRMAQAVFATLAGQPRETPLRVTAETGADKEGRLVARLTLRNESSTPRRGRLAVYPAPQDDAHESFDYALDPGGTAELAFSWPEGRMAVTPRWLQVVDYHGDGSRAWAVSAPSRPDAHWLRERTVTAEPRTVARLKVGDQTHVVPVEWPADAQVGRVPLARPVSLTGGAVVLRAELAYVRHAAAASGEARADGDLSEWSDAAWVPVGEPVQARWTKGPADYREQPADCYLHWAFKAGREGVWLAFRGEGNLSKDRFTVYFDNRPTDALGTAGPYTWVDGGFKSDGTLALRAGDSSPSGIAGLAGRWIAHGETARVGEIFVPYALLNAAGWPSEGDLGVSIVWMHPHEDGRVTRLMWSENGHPWNTRWFGVVRRDPSGPLPWRVRVE